MTNTISNICFPITIQRQCYNFNKYWTAFLSRSSKFSIQCIANYYQICPSLIIQSRNTFVNSVSWNWNSMHFRKYQFNRIPNAKEHRCKENVDAKQNTTKIKWRNGYLSCGASVQLILWHRTDPDKVGSNQDIWNCVHVRPTSNDCKLTDSVCSRAFVFYMFLLRTIVMDCWNSLFYRGNMFEQSFDISISYWSISI